MNKAELVTAVAGRLGLPCSHVEPVLSELLAVIRSEVKQGNKVKLVGFGVFCKSLRKGRNSHSLKTGTRTKLPPTWVPKFRPGMDFKKDIAASTDL